MTMTPNHLRRDLIIILLIKLSIVMFAASFIFGPRQRPVVDSDSLDRRILNNSYP
jgi:hypothetical protein